MAELAERATNQILLLAPELLGESLALQLTNANPELEVVYRSNQLSRQPSLVIWSVDNLEMPSAIQIELRRLQDNWQPSPVLLLLPRGINLSANELLQFDCPGLLQDPDLQTLKESIKTLIGGGRVVRLKQSHEENHVIEPATAGLGQWLLVTGLQQISQDLQVLETLLSTPPENILIGLLLKGRRRELRTSRALLLWIWGPPKFAIASLSIPKNSPNGNTYKPEKGDNGSLDDGFGTSISLKERNALAVWTELQERLTKSVENDLVNSTNSLLAIEGLNSAQQKNLLVALVNQLIEVVNRIRNSNPSETPIAETWSNLQQELRQEAMRNMIGSYIRIPRNGELTPVADKLLEMSDLLDTDDDLPQIERMLDPLILDKPVLTEGQLLPADDPRALIELEMLFSNWLIRTAELISSEAIGVCGEWPELRHYLLNPHLISTRELERLRNQLNSQNRWKNLIQRPIQLYESKRLLYRIRMGHIEPILITEPRDDELRQLGWWQQQVALLVETRDALAPQLQALVKRIGDLMVVILTQVIGRAIGLVGRGIAQGMGRNLGRS